MMGQLAKDGTAKDRMAKDGIRGEGFGAGSLCQDRDCGSVWQALSEQNMTVSDDKT